MQIIHCILVACVAFSTIGIGDAPGQLVRSGLAWWHVAAFYWVDTNLTLWAFLALGLFGTVAIWLARRKQKMDVSLLRVYAIAGLALLLWQLTARIILALAPPVTIQVSPISISNRQYMISWELTPGAILLVAPALAALIVWLSAPRARRSPGS